MLEPASGRARKVGVAKFDCITALKALGEENRMRIVRMLLKKRRSVNEIAEELGVSQYNVSKHLRVLREAELLEQEKNGQRRLYALASDFSAHLSENKNVLDLGCCQFDFNKLPK
jgi:DNA-binding transcriptional ArsR family regulator